MPGVMTQEGMTPCGSQGLRTGLVGGGCGGAAGWRGTPPRSLSSKGLASGTGLSGADGNSGVVGGTGFGVGAGGVGFGVGCTTPVDGDGAAGWLLGRNNKVPAVPAIARITAALSQYV